MDPFGQPVGDQPGQHLGGGVPPGERRLLVEVAVVEVGEHGVQLSVARPMSTRIPSSSRSGPRERRVDDERRAVQLLRRPEHLAAAGCGRPSCGRERSLGTSGLHAVAVRVADRVAQRRCRSRRRPRPSPREGRANGERPGQQHVERRVASSSSARVSRSRWVRGAPSSRRDRPDLAGPDGEPRGVEGPAERERDRAVAVPAEVEDGALRRPAARASGCRPADGGAGVDDQVAAAGRVGGSANSTPRPAATFARSGSTSTRVTRTPGIRPAAGPRSSRPSPRRRPRSGRRPAARRPTAR